MRWFSVLLPTLCALTILGAYAAGIDAGLPTASRGAVTFTDRTGIALGTVLPSDSAHAISVPLHAISPLFVQAIVAAEDARFARHGAIDALALARAAREYLIFGEARSGGSTVAMQLARLRDPAPSSLREKLKQIIAAERFAIRTSKRDSRTYFNRAPMGGNLYGVEAAARTYFGEPASELDLAQARCWPGSRTIRGGSARSRL